MKKTPVLLFATLMFLGACNAAPPTVVNTTEGIGVSDYVNLVLDNRLLEEELAKLGEELGAAHASRDEARDRAHEAHEEIADWQYTTYYMSQYLPEDEKSRLLCPNWPSFVIHVESKGYNDRCWEWEQMHDYVNELERIYPEWYRYPELEQSEERPCINYCDQVEVVDEYPEAPAAEEEDSE